MSNEYVTVTIVSYPAYVSWHIRKSDATVVDENLELEPMPEIDSSGTDPLSSTNGCYDSLLSNVMTECSNRCLGPIDQWIIRKG